jgi:ABC-type transport system involved in multi-copper enzyme maturation permease subunit
MLTRLARFDLPLLGKELLEQAARKRTYIVRVLYAALLFGGSFLLFHDTLRTNAAGALAVLGKGKELLTTLVWLQFAGVCLFTPALTCGVLTQEKEHASLQLLFLTRLGPWTILFEKLLSRLIPMFGFLILSLPLLAFAYTLGGVTPAKLVMGVWILILATIQMGTLALMCSAFFRTTVGAFIWSYLLGLLMFGGPPLMWVTLNAVGFNVNGFLRNVEASSNIAFLPVIVVPLAPAALWTSGPASFMSANKFWPLAAQSTVILAVSGLCLVLARSFLVSRAFLPPRNVVLNVFKRLDRFFVRLNDNRVTRGFEFGAVGGSLPVDEPVAWRETAKRSLGTTRYLVRLFIALELPTAALCLILIVAALNSGPLTMVLFLLWIISALFIAVQSASLIAGERSQQTLDVLCTTPLSGRQILLQKFRSVRRLMYVLAVPIATLVAFECGMRWRMAPIHWRGIQHEFDLALYVTCSILSIAVYFPLIAWLSFLIGLKVRTHARAIMAATATIVVWCVAPIFLVTIPLEILFGHPGRLDREFINCSTLLGPATIIPINEFSELPEFGSPWLAVCSNFLVYGALALLFRTMSLDNADRWLGRSSDLDFTGSRTAPAAAATLET